MLGWHVETAELPVTEPVVRPSFSIERAACDLSPHPRYVVVGRVWCMTIPLPTKRVAPSYSAWLYTKQAISSNICAHIWRGQARARGAHGLRQVVVALAPDVRAARWLWRDDFSGAAPIRVGR